MAGTAISAQHHQAMGPAGRIDRELLFVVALSSHTKHFSSAQALPGPSSS